MVDSLCRPFSSDFFNLSQYLGDLSQQLYAVYTLKLSTRYDYENDEGLSIWLASDESISIPSIQILPGDRKWGAKVSGRQNSSHSFVVAVSHLNKQMM